MAKTAAEILAALGRNEEYQRMMRERETRWRIFERKLRVDQKYLVADLEEVGIIVDFVSDLVNTANPYPEAIPVLVKHLRIRHHAKTLAAIARSLAVRDCRENAEVWNVLMDCYRTAEADEAIGDPEHRGFKDGLAVAISYLCDRERLPEMIELIRDRKHGSSRVFLVDRLSRFKLDPDVKESLRALREDEQISLMMERVFKRKWK